MASRVGENPDSPDERAAVRLVVGLGSSAGGLEALQQVVSQLVLDSATTYVVAQHLAPDHPSLIVELLAGATPLRVVSAIDGMTLEPDTIVVGPPNSDLWVDAAAVRMMQPEVRSGPAPSIDVLFDSLALHWPGRSVAVVLSGTGSDGAEGLRLVRATGGLTMAQSPDTARFPAMPQAAIALGGADLVLAPAEIGSRLAALCGDASHWSGDAIAEPDDVVISSVAAVLRRAVGVDFSQYKESTVRRQVRRRMAVCQVHSVPEYLALLTSDLAEAHALSRNLLVTVTSFFRDRDAFTAIGATVRRMVRERRDGEQLRVWVPGCATGEEVYSLAMLCSEALGDPDDLTDRLKIFGTDLDEVSLGVARRALYPASSIGAIPEPYRSRYVHVTDEGVEVTPALRACVVFARHNVAENPPFPRIDLVSCRNTLIYFTPALQEQVLHLIRYALAPGGVLFLGSAEAVGARTPGFAVLDAANRIFQLDDEHGLGLGPPPRIRAPRSAVPPAARRRAVSEEVQRTTQHLDVLEALLRASIGPSLVLDEAKDLLEVVGDVSPFCRVPEGRVLRSAGAFVRPELRDEATAMSLLVQPGDAPLAGRSIHLDGVEGAVHLVAQPLAVAGRDLVVLSFVVDSEAGTSTEPDERELRAERELERLERELVASHQAVRAYTADLQAANEELEASSEELQASSEELQSSIEELEASNEELEASNDELASLNTALRARNAEQAVLNADLQNIQVSLSQGMVMVDNDLRITRFTPLAVRVFSVVDTDIGTPLASVPLAVPIPGLDTALREVVNGHAARSLEALGASHSYIVQVAPYLDTEGVRRGAIVTLTDVTEMAALRATADDAVREFTTVIDALDEVVWKCDLAMEHVAFVSNRLVDMIGWTPAEVMADPSLLDGCVDTGYIERVKAARIVASSGWVVEYPITTRGGAMRWIRESAVVVADNRERDGYVVGTLADVTDRVAVAAKAVELSSTFEAVFETRLFGVAVLDAEAHIVMANAAFGELVGYGVGELRGMPLTAFDRAVPADDASFADRHVAAEPATAGARVLVRRDGTRRMVTVDVRPLDQVVADATTIVIVQDVTELADSVERLARQAHFDEAITGLLNRSSFAAALERDIDRCARHDDTLALLWLDLDRFKEINDQHGHAAGDEVLKVAAARLVEAVRGSDAVGRLGGDEFGIIVEGIARVEALDPLLRRVLAALREPIVVGDAIVTVAGSVGVARYPSDGTNVHDLMRAADTAMYAAKAQGGNAATDYSDAMNEATERRRATRVAIDEAIDHHDFELYYQPIVATADRSPWGVEALLRWRHDGEVVDAATFIDFAEDTGQIRSLGPETFALLRRDLEQLRDAGFPNISVSVNLSVTQLEDHSLTDQLATWPMASGLRGLVVEVVESVFLPGNARALHALSELVAHGAQVSIDDFGSGFSNLLLLETLSPSFVKLDRTMLLTGAVLNRGRALVRCAVELAHAVGAQAVVEGVENEEQMELAVSVGADLVQGYLLGRPMSLKDLQVWLAEAR